MWDHKLIILSIPSTQKQPRTIIKCSWKNYSKDCLLAELVKITFAPEPNDLQKYNLLPIIDKLAPKVPLLNNVTIKSTKPNKYIKNKLNLS